MELTFLGNGSGFADEHTSAYFITEKKEMVIIDCSMLNIPKLKKMDLSSYKSFIILITHTHGDHISGLGLLVQYCFFTLNKKITIVAPSESVRINISYLLNEIEGCEDSWYYLLSARDFKASWFVRPISTTHTPQLKEKCFGYYLKINGTNVIYTGDTNSISSFESYLVPNTEFYVDVCINLSPVHLNLKNMALLSRLISLAENNIHVYLIHVDDAKTVQSYIHNIPNLNLAKPI